ncbi:uncharacterized protein LOC117066070 [Trachypithecus francoisi]|uniref:uncharacterized protein LOC117066070 n=1 Tax=Trachypithecus francoisi TaxID=54180 RepID=UPI00141B3A0D|nr:uncharacterized protein LOC117066070 [Trachypithecus francoisi]
MQGRRVCPGRCYPPSPLATKSGLLALRLLAASQLQSQQVQTQQAQPLPREQLDSFKLLGGIKDSPVHWSFGSAICRLIGPRAGGGALGRCREKPELLWRAPPLAPQIEKLKHGEVMQLAQVHAAGKNSVGVHVLITRDVLLGTACRGLEDLLLLR